MPLVRLHAAAQERGIEVPARATRQQLAGLLVRHSSRERAEEQYRTTGIAFDSRASAYPPIRRLVTRLKLRQILDVGCGPGLFAEELRAGRALPPDGCYAGLDVSRAAIELARTRFADDPRFVFHVGDAEAFRERLVADIDGVVISFVLSYLDTHAVDRLFKTLARMYPRAAVIVALTFRSCVDRLEGVEPDDQRELRAARRYLAGDVSAADGIWDVRRLVCYRESFLTYYKLVDARVLKSSAQVLWVGQLATAQVR